MEHEKGVGRAFSPFLLMLVAVAYARKRIIRGGGGNKSIRFMLTDLKFSPALLSSLLA